MESILAGHDRRGKWQGAICLSGENAGALVHRTISRQTKAKSCSPAGRVGPGPISVNQPACDKKMATIELIFHGEHLSGSRPTRKVAGSDLLVRGKCRCLGPSDDKPANQRQELLAGRPSWSRSDKR